MTLQTSYPSYFVERERTFIWTEGLTIHFLRPAVLTIHAVFAHEDLHLPLKSTKGLSVCLFVH